MASSMRDKAKDLKSSRAFKEATSDLRKVVAIVTKEKAELEVAHKDTKELLDTLKEEYKLLQ